MKKRDLNVLAHIRRGISLSTRTVANKKRYSRKTKHKNRQDF